MTNHPKIARHFVLTSVTAMALLSSISCKKAAAPPPAQDKQQAAVPDIDTSGDDFGGDDWLTQKVAHDHAASAGAGNSYAHVTYKPEVKVLDEAAVLPSMVGVSTDGHGVVFNNASAGVLALKAGDILMVPGRFAAKILGAETDGAQTVLIVDTPRMVELVAQGDVHLDTPIQFNGPGSAQTEPAAHPFHLRDLVERPVYAAQLTGQSPDLQPGYNTPQPGISVKTPTSRVSKSAIGALTSGWTVEKWSVTPAGESATLALKMTKNTGGFLALITMDGSISNFQFAQNLHFPVQTAPLLNGVKKMSGKMHFTWQISKGTPGIWVDADKLKLPTGLTIPLQPLLGGMPLQLDISTALLVHPALTGGNEFEQGAFTLGWNGDGTGEGLTFEIDKDQSISAVAPAGMVISFCVPRIELDVTPISSAAAGIPGMFLKGLAAGIDAIVGKIAAKLLSAATLAALKASPAGNFTASNVLASKADLYVQLVHTEGVTHSPNISLVPCSKIQLKMTGQWGGDAQLLGMTPGATTTKDLFTKEFDRWNPGSDFCKSI